MLIKRRDFLKVGSLATASTFIPKFLKAFERDGLSFVPPGNKVAVVLQLSGGNDGLNTIIPVRNDIYYKARPTLSVAGKDALRLTDDVSLNASLKNFKAMYDDGSLAILNNVGYPNPDRSHFRSMDIWQSGSKSDQYWSSGWIGRYLDAECNGCDRPTKALEMDNLLSLSLKGETTNGIAFTDIKELYNNTQEDFFKNVSLSGGDHHDPQPVDYLYKTMAQTISSADYIFEQSRLNLARGQYPNTQIGKYFKTIASLIFSNIDTKVYYISLGTFDTHFNQVARQEKLFKDMDDAVYAFVQDLKTNNRFNDVLLFTFSEFGRRVAQNASNGTDHGTANNMFLLSGALKQKGLINEMPNLLDLNEGDLKYSVDFKSVYATILNKWLNVDDEKVLKNKFDHLNFI